MDRYILVDRYIVDKRGSRFTVKAFAGGALAAMGHNPTIAIRDFAGEVHFDPADPGRASMRIQIRADSLEVTDDINSGDRLEIENMMNQKVLESSRYPEIVFESTGASAEKISEGRYRIPVNGNLSLHGVTRGLPVIVHVTASGETLRAHGEFSILQSDYGIPLVSMAGGVLKVKDQLKLAFDLLARTQARTQE